jgi:hypothetical protein
VSTNTRSQLKQRLQALKEMVSSGSVGGFVAGGVGKKNVDDRPQKKYKPTLKDMGGSNPVITRDGTVAESEEKHTVYIAHSLREHGGGQMLLKNHIRRATNPALGEARMGKHIGNVVRKDHRGREMGEKHHAFEFRVKSAAEQFARSTLTHAADGQEHKIVVNGKKMNESVLLDRLAHLREAVSGNNVDPTGNSYPAAGQYPGTDDPTGTKDPGNLPQKPKKPAKRYSGKEYKPDGQIKSTWRPIGVQNPSGRGRAGSTTSDYSIPNANSGQQSP